MAKFCPKCGTKVEGNNKFCGACGFEVDKDIIVENTSQQNNGVINQNTDIDRTPELILALIGGIIGIVYGAYAIYVASAINSIASSYSSLASSVGSQVGSSAVSQAGAGVGSFLSMGITGIYIVGIIVIIAGIISIFAGIQMRKDTKLYGILLILAACLFLVSMSWYAAGCAVFTGIAGILLLTRK